MRTRTRLGLAAAGCALTAWGAGAGDSVLLPPPTPISVPLPPGPAAPVPVPAPAPPAAYPAPAEPCPPAPCPVVPPTRIRVVIPPPEIVYRQAPACESGKCGPAEKPRCAAAAPAAAVANTTFTVPFTYAIPYQTYAMAPVGGMAAAPTLGMGGFAAGYSAAPLGFAGGVPAVAPAAAPAGACVTLTEAQLLLLADRLIRATRAESAERRAAGSLDHPGKPAGDEPVAAALDHLATEVRQIKLRLVELSTQTVAAAGAQAQLSDALEARIADLRTEVEALRAKEGAADRRAKDLEDRIAAQVKALRAEIDALKGRKPGGE